MFFFGYHSVINGDLSVGALVAFNMISSQAIQPILRHLRNFGSDLQQVQISVERLGDVLNSWNRRRPPVISERMGKPEGRIAFDNVSFFAIAAK